MNKPLIVYIDTEDRAVSKRDGQWYWQDSPAGIWRKLPFRPTIDVDRSVRWFGDSAGDPPNE